MINFAIAEAVVFEAVQNPSVSIRKVNYNENSIIDLNQNKMLDLSVCGGKPAYSHKRCQRNAENMQTCYR